MININQIYKCAFVLRDKLAPKAMLATYKDKKGLECLYMDDLNNCGSYTMHANGFSCNVFSAQQGNKFIGWLDYRDETGFSFTHKDDKSQNQKYLNLICGIWREKGEPKQ